MNDRLRDFIEITSKAFRTSLAKINKVYLLFAVILVRAIIQNNNFIGILGAGMTGGLIGYFVDAFILCYLLQTLRSVVVYGNTGKASISNSFTNFIQPVLSTLFFIYLIQMLLRMIGTISSFSFYIILLLVFEFLMSAYLEEIYINNHTGFTAIKQSAKFVCDNILTYGLFSLICLLLQFYINYNFAFSLGFTSSKFITILVLAVLELIYYVVRGHLFKELNNHSYRQRKFMRGY